MRNGSLAGRPWVALVHARCDVRAGPGHGIGASGAEVRAANQLMIFHPAKIRCRLRGTYDPLQTKSWAYYCGGDHHNFDAGNNSYCLG